MSAIEKSDFKVACTSVVLGGYVNAYSIIRELHENYVENIWLIDYGKSLSRQSNMIKGALEIEKTASSLLTALLKLNEEYDRLIIFPTDDLQLDLLLEIYDDIKDFCFLPFNEENIKISQDKSYQYKVCDEYNIPYPKSIRVENENDFKKIENFQFPLIIKPNTRADLTQNIFRSKIFEDKYDLDNNIKYLAKYLKDETTFLLSEFIPGDDTEIYAYTCYRSKRGKILNEWRGKKLTQFPNEYGVFSSASNQAPEVVSQQGRDLVHAMDAYGIIEPEFKYDARDQKYKLMEVNLRSMMWHRMGNLSGVFLQYSQWLDGQGLEVPEFNEKQEKKVHLVYMKHELGNLLTRKGYSKHFFANIWGAEQRHFVIFNPKDIKPFLFDLIRMPFTLARLCQKVYFKK